MPGLEISELNKGELEKFYGVFSVSLNDDLGFSRYPVGGMGGILCSGERTQIHSHHENEVFVVLSGCGEIISDSDTTPIKPGTVYFSRAFDSHQLTASSDTDLRFVSFWWDDATEREAAARRKLARSEPTPSYYLITATPPTPNGDLHLGHLSGPYLAADILSRALQSRNHLVHTMTGIDTNQSYVPLKAHLDGGTPKDIANRYSNRIRRAFAVAEMHFDTMLDPEIAPDYTRNIQSFFSELFKSGEIVSRQRKALFCKSTGQYLFEAHIQGNCPYCRVMCDGNACEKCGLPNQCFDLGSSNSKYGSGQTEVKTIKQLVIPLEPHRNMLQAFWDTVSMKPALKMLCKQLSEKPLPEIAITHPAEWGVPCTIPEFSHQVYYVWAEMAAGFYVTLNQSTTKRFRESRSEWIQCFGFDNAFFYCVLFPVLWRAINPDVKLPDRFITNEFLLLNNKKFSTSRQHAIWGLDFLNNRNVDVVRFYLARCSPEDGETNFCTSEFEAHYKAFWINEMSAWFNLLAATSDYHEHKISSTGAWSIEHISFYSTIEMFAGEMQDRHFEPSQYSLFRATWALEGFVRDARRFSLLIAKTTASGDEYRTALQLQLSALIYVAIAVYPICPTLGCKLWTVFRLDDTPTWEKARLAVLKTESIDVERLVDASEYINAFENGIAY